MVVDDETIISMQLENRLKQLGYNIAGNASTAEEAISLADQLKPDLILMDIVMPGKLDGIEAAGIIRRDLDIPVIFLTAWADEELVKRAKDVQPYGYIVKPYNEREIQATIEVALHKISIDRHLKNQERHLRSVINTLDDAVLSFDGDNRIMFANEAAETLFGYTSAELIGKPVSMLIVPEYIDIFNDYSRAVLDIKDNIDSETSFSLVVRNKLRQELTMDVSLVPADTAAQPVITMISHIHVELPPAETVGTEKQVMPICSSCKKVRNENGRWLEIEAFLKQRFNIDFTHSICPTCVRRLYPDIDVTEN